MQLKFSILKIGQIPHIVVVYFLKNAWIHKGNPQDFWNPSQGDNYILIPKLVKQFFSGLIRYLIE